MLRGQASNLHLHLVNSQATCQLVDPGKLPAVFSLGLLQGVFESAGSPPDTASAYVRLGHIGLDPRFASTLVNLVDMTGYLGRKIVSGF